ncbi:YesL family protein [Paenarthrobacter ureafaciens]|uniref:YesL family protein n=1 Tax=Paenarthrobacter ureafaciens TaxID=37931 RepID=UPI001C2BB326|nr:YesL family protein [Paenarthrobacter ureafaciens]
MAATKVEFGSGTLFRAAGIVHGIMVGDALLVLANALLVLTPVLVGIIGPLALISLILAGPSFVAACYAFNRLHAHEDTGVFHDFMKSYRSNFGQALVVWLPYLVVLVVIAFNLSVLPGNLGPGTGTNPAQVAARIGLLGVGVMVATAAVKAMLLLSRFSFRTSDIYRLSVYALGAQRRVSLGNAGILFVTAFVLMMTTAWLILFVSGLVVYLICLNSRPLLKFVEIRFT